MNDVTQILHQIEAGDSSASEQLLPLVYEELRKLAAARMAQERPDHTLQATALVHEAYVRLVDKDQAHYWDSRGHFFAAAAQAMRRILVEQARRKSTDRCGGDHFQVDLPAVAMAADADQIDLIALDEAMKKLEQLHPEKAEIVNLRFFAGFSLEESAAALGISRATTQRHWAYARAWLYGQLGNE